MQPLPIDPLLPAIAETVATRRRLVLEAPPGAGKTTRVPRALLDANIGAGEILVLEPRRLAARMAARRVAEELGERVGETVGYTMRFEEAASARTRIRFVTEGVLTRRLVRDPELGGVSAVVLDEFHERHLHADVALSLLRRLQRGARPDLALVVMSATLAAAPVAAYLDAPVLRAEGRLFEVAIEHLERTEERPLEMQVASAVRRLAREGLDGDVLVFLPGAAEIRRATEALGAVAGSENLLVLPLHGSLSPAEQDRAVRPADRRKVILSTNVAESSVTIDGVVAVIDSGLARVASHAPWSGLPTLRIAKIARASATQRAGRAGRTRPGRALRLYTRGDLMARPEHDTPEILRVDLAETVLELYASGISSLDNLTFLDPPPPAALTAAEELLVRLGALDEGKRPTTIGRRMLRFPAHPRQARILVEAEARGVAEEGAAIAALLGERDLGAGGLGLRGARHAGQHRSDVIAMLDQLDEAEGVSFQADRLRYMGLEPARVQAVERVRKQLAGLVDRRKVKAPGDPEAHKRALLISTLAGYPDRVGRLRRPENATGRSQREIVLATGGSAILAESSVVGEEELVVAVDAEERSEGKSARVTVRVASAVEADWLLDLFTEAIRDTTEMRWNASAERVEVTRRLSYENLILEEKRAGSGDPAAVSAALAEAAIAKGWRTFVREGELEGFLGRVAFVRKHCPEAELPAIDEAAIEGALRMLCEGRQSFAELRAADLGGAVQGLLTPEQARRVIEWAPESITLPGGRKLKLTYAPDGTVSGASRLQDFFGMAEGPRVARGRVPVVLHLLAPNQRDVQVTTDLAGFWERHYPGIARELRRRYPRHSWPDDPRRAEPPAPPPARRSGRP
jgi:ATP-dependent helicase HrpB